MRKTIEQVDAIMARIDEPDRYRWCGAENGPCACLGCVQICSRSLMYEKTFARQHRGDPEYIDERRIPPVIREAFRITHEEWEAWKLRHPEPPRDENYYSVTCAEPGTKFAASAEFPTLPGSGFRIICCSTFVAPNDIPIDGVPAWVVAAARRVQVKVYEGDWSVETIARLIHEEAEAAAELASTTNTKGE